MTGSKGNSEFCFPRISMFPETRETLRFEGNKIHYSPRDQSLSDLLHVYSKISVWFFFQNFRKVKVALNSMYRISLNFAKSCILFGLSKFYNKKNFTVLFLKYKRLKLK